MAATLQSLLVEDGVAVITVRLGERRETSGTPLVDVAVCGVRLVLTATSASQATGLDPLPEATQLPIEVVEERQQPVEEQQQTPRVAVVDPFEWRLDEYDEEWQEDEDVEEEENWHWRFKESTHDWEEFEAADASGSPSQRPAPGPAEATTPRAPITAPDTDDWPSTGGLYPLTPLPRRMRTGKSKKLRINAAEYEVDRKRLHELGPLRDIILVDAQYRMDYCGRPSEICEIAMRPLVGDGPSLHHHLPTTTVSADTRTNRYLKEHVTGYPSSEGAVADTSAASMLDIHRLAAGKILVTKGLQKALILNRIFSDAAGVFCVVGLPPTREALPVDYGRCAFHANDYELNCAANIVAWMRLELSV